MQQHVFAISSICAHAGVRHALICPGSRSAPLVYAFSTQKDITCYPMVDERSAGFMALGMAEQLKEPVVLICTSGSAVLNFFPAVAEAYYRKIPLIILSADRPPELLNQQDGQMIMQKGVFGKHVRMSVELPCYQHGKEDFRETIHILATAIAKAIGVPQGPVHVNIPLSDPLYPAVIKIPKVKIPESSKGIAMKGASGIGSHPMVNQKMARLAKAWSSSTKKLIIIGQNQVDNNLYNPLHQIFKNNDAVILSDVLSNKHQVCSVKHFDFILSHANDAILDRLKPDLIVSICGPMISKQLKGWLKTQKPNYHFRISVDKGNVDTYRNVTDFIYEHPSVVFQELLKLEPVHHHHTYNDYWKSLDIRARHEMENYLSKVPLTELKVASDIFKLIPPSSNVHLANSSVVRYASLLGKLQDSWVMSGNRGTSGIDGCLSTASGAAMVNSRLTCLITGDLGFLYDRNALWNQNLPDNLRIIVFNNHEGGIFRLIDGPMLHKKQLKYFTTPHSISMKNISMDSGLAYYYCNSEHNLKQTMVSFFKMTNKAALLEIDFDPEMNAAYFKSFKSIRLKV